MTAFVTFYLQVLVSMVAICDPLGNIPIFVSLTGGPDRPDERKTARMAAIAVFVVLTIFAFFGQRILGMFSISLSSFRVGGGIVLLLMGISMLRATPGPIRQKKEEMEEGALRENVAVVPLAIPLLSGPGAMSTAVLYSHRASGFVEHAAQHAAHLTTALIVYGAMRLAHPVSRRLGQTGINIVTRVMGLIVIAIGVEFIAAGARELFPSLSAGIS